MPIELTGYCYGLTTCFKELERSYMSVLERIKNRLQSEIGTIYIIGNGGSASTASHMANDLQRVGVRAISLTDNVGILTARGNDVNYESIFVEQLKILLKSYDTLIALSVSGTSKNIINAVDYAKASNLVTTIGFTGCQGGRLKYIVDYGIFVSSDDYGVVEDFHLSLNHIICQNILIDKKEFTPVKKEGWIGVDLDGTLAKTVTKDWDGPIGEPIPAMVNRVKMWLKQGREVRILTARASRYYKDGREIPQKLYTNVIHDIMIWCKEVFGEFIPITSEKDHNMIQLWDDKAIQVVRDTGEQVE